MLKTYTILNGKKLKEIRNHLKNDPFNWPAHKLMNHIDGLERLANKQILQSYDYSDEEIEEIFIHIENGGQLSEEEITCSNCGGNGHTYGGGCFGKSFQKCDVCYHGRRTRPCIKK